MVEIDIEKRQINALVSQDEFAERRKSWVAPASKLETRGGYLSKYVKLVSSASEGCTTDHMKAPSSMKNSSARRDPLHVQLRAEAVLDESHPSKTRAKYAKREKSREARDKRDTVDEKTSRKILQQASQQLAEDDDDMEYTEVASSAFQGAAEISDSEDDHEEANDTAAYSDFEEFDHEGLEGQMSGMNQADRAILAEFMPETAPERRNLATIIMEKMRQHEQEQAAKSKPRDAVVEPIKPHLNEKIIEVYEKVGTILSRYKSGKLPKAFKIIPSLSNWEEIVHLTKPESWTPNAMFEATRIFASNLKPKMAQRFYNLILLDAVRQNIAENKKVNCHLYMALKKAVYKPAAWFKGVLLPLCEDGCTLREAIIVSSVLTKVSVPALHSAAALLKLAEMEYTGATSIFIRVLLDKKYALPFRVIDALIFHFIRFKNDKRKLPVLWHQSMLVFCQRYKEDLAPDQKEALLELIKYQTHPQISAEVRRELMNSKCRDDMEMTVCQPETSQSAILSTI